MKTQNFCKCNLKYLLWLWNFEDFEIDPEDFKLILKSKNICLSCCCQKWTFENLQTSEESKNQWNLIFEFLIFTLLSKLDIRKLLNVTLKNWFGMITPLHSAALWGHSEKSQSFSWKFSWQKSKSTVENQTPFNTSDWDWISE